MTTRGRQVAKVIADAPVSAKGILERAFDGKAGRKNAVTAMCLVCTGFDRQAVRGCSAWACPLWAWRPFQSSAETPLKSGVPEPEKEAAGVAKEPA